MWFVGTVLAAYVAVCAFLYVGQRSMIYYPTPDSGHDRAEDLRIESGDAVIQVWKIGSGDEDAILYFGGNAEDVTLNIDEFSRDFASHTIYLANYRGYGASTGSPTETAILRDAETLFDEISNDHSRITVIGRSLGTGVAVHLGTAKDVSRLVLVTPYDSLANVAAGKFPVLPVSLLIRDRFDSKNLAGLIAIPTLVLAAEHDEVIPVRHARSLAESIRRDLLEFVVVDGAGHNTIGDFPEYRNAMLRFLHRSDHQF